MKNFITIFALVLIAKFSIGSIVSTQVPIGTIIPFGGATCPAGTVLANGASVLRAGVYAPLFSAISTTWGSVDGTHFTLPPLQNRMLRGAGSATDGNGGTAVSLGAFQDHSTAVNGLHDTGHTHSNSLTSNTSVLFAAGNSSAGADGRQIGSTGTVGITNASATAVLAGDTETRQKAYGVNFCIKY